MASDLLLASAADNVAIWECQSYNIVKQYDPFKENVSGIAWSHDNMRLVSTCEKLPHISMSLVKGSTVVSTDFATELTNNVGRKCISFNSRSRYLITGGTDHIVYIHDLKSRSLRKSYSVHASPITCVLFNHNDTYVASGDEKGWVIVHNVSTGQSSSPLIAPKVQAIKQLQYSPFHKATLASVSHDGALNLWDTNTRRLLHSFKDCHKAPATGLVMSTVNDSFMVSVGLDKKIVFYDSSSRKLVNTLESDSPLTSVDMLFDGYTLAVGTMRGKILIYDLRMAHNQHLTTLTLHNSSVQSLKFQRPVPMSTGSTSRSPQSIMSQSNDTTSFMNTPSIDRTNPAPNKDIHDMVDVFSPLRDDLSDTSSTPQQNSSSLTHLMHDMGVISPLNPAFDTSISLNESASASYIALPTNDSLSYNPSTNEKRSYNTTSNENQYSTPANEKSRYNSITNEKSVNNSSINERLSYNQKTSSTNDRSPYIISTNEKVRPKASPLVNDCIVVQTGKGSVLTKPQTNSSQNTTDTRDDISLIPVRLYPQNQQSDIINGTIDNTHDFTWSNYNQNCDESSSIIKTDTRLSGHPSLSTLTNGLNTHNEPQYTSSPIDTVQSSKHTSSSTRTVQSPTNHHSALLPEILNKAATEVTQNNRNVRVTNDTSDTSIGATAGVVVPAPTNAFSLQRDLIRSIVEESLDDLREDCHNDALNICTTMISLYHSQMEKMEAMMKYYSVNEDLIAENERLRAEIDRLKTTF